MEALHHETPLFESPALSRHSGRRTWLKLEAMQPPGSFKIRGIGRACQAYARDGASRFISSSGGNAGIAVAYAGRRLKVPVLVVVPESTTERAKALIRQEGAEVIVHGASFHEANAHAQSLIGDTDAFIHPFDDPLVWSGHSTLIDEVVRAGVKPGAVVLSVGGGGLLSGVAEGLRRHGWEDIPVVTVETEGAASLIAAVRAGKPVELPAVTTIATSLAARQVCDRAYAETVSLDVRNAVVSDKAAVAACIRFVDDHRIVVEPACGAALSVGYHGAPELDSVDSVMVIVCGGVTASLDQLEAWAMTLD